MSELQTLLKNLCLHLGWPDSAVSDEGLDVDLGNGSLHIRHRDGLITMMIPVDAECPSPIFTDMSIWPSVNLSQLDNGSFIIWAREWVDKLDYESIESCISSLLRLQLEILELKNGQESALPERASGKGAPATLASFRV